MFNQTSSYWLCLSVPGAEGGRLEQDQIMAGLYSHHAAQRPESSSSASPPSHPHFPTSFPSASSGSGMLVVPQPINASKVSQATLSLMILRTRARVLICHLQMSAMGGDPVGFSHHHMNGGQRKYQCKMCPQVGATVLFITFNHHGFWDITWWATEVSMKLIKLCAKSLT